MENIELKELQRPIPLRWRVQRAIPSKDNPTHVIMVGYINSRDIQSRLDEVVGIGGWQNRYFDCKGKQFCEIGIKVDGEWIWKGDSGSQSQTEKEKGETSDSFKRAAVHWGINRVAYDVGEVKLPCKISTYGGKSVPYPIDQTGKFLKGQNLFNTCNSLAKIEEYEIEFDKSLMELTERNKMTPKERERIILLIKEATSINQLDAIFDNVPDDLVDTYLLKKESLSTAKK